MYTKCKQVQRASADRGNGGVWGQPAAGIGSLAALHVVVFVVDQCAACSAASDIKMLGLLRPEPNRADADAEAEPNCRAIVINCATEFGSNFAGKLRVAMRRQIRFGCSTQATVQPGWKRRRVCAQAAAGSFGFSCLDSSSLHV